MLTKRPSPVSLDSDTPGMRPSASAALKSGYFLIVSIDWMLTRTGAIFYVWREMSSCRDAVTTMSCGEVVAAPSSGASASAGTAIKVANIVETSAIVRIFITKIPHSCCNLKV